MTDNTFVTNGYAGPEYFCDRVGSNPGYTKDERYYDLAGSLIGRINKGTIYDRSGSTIGRVKGVPSNVAALIFLYNMYGLR